MNTEYGGTDRGEAVRLRGAGLLALALALSGGALAQPSGGAALPLSAPAEARTRAELLTLLDQVQAQIEDLPPGGPQAAGGRLLELRSQLELLLLQAQLEALQRENAALQARLRGGSPGGGAGLSALERRMGRLDAQQANMNAQLQVIAGQHAAILGAAPTEEARRHVVRPGDSLSEIAETYYGSAGRWPELLEANPGVADPDRLLVGTELRIP